MSYFDDALDRIRGELSRNVVRMVMWYDPLGVMWIAPLGSTTPDPDRPVPPEWIPVKRLSRSEVEPS